PGVISTTVMSGRMPKKARVWPGWRQGSRATLPSARQLPLIAACNAASGAGRLAASAGLVACAAGTPRARAMATAQAAERDMRIMHGLLREMRPRLALGP